MRKFKLEQLDEVLNHPAIEITRNDTDDFRVRSFQVFGAGYVIEWWKNICYLHSPDGLLVPFYSAKVSSTWPNNAKTNLQFYNENGKVCAILEIEK